MLTAAGHEVARLRHLFLRASRLSALHRARGAGGANGECERGIVLGGSGNGEQITANKVRGIRCALGFSLDTARWAKMHNDCQCPRDWPAHHSRGTGAGIVQTWLSTEFEGGRHVARLNGIAAVENSQSQGRPNLSSLRAHDAYSPRISQTSVARSTAATCSNGRTTWPTTPRHSPSPRRPSSPVAWRRLISPHRWHNGDIGAHLQPRRARGHEFLHRGGVVYRCRNHTTVFSTSAIMVHITPTAAKRRFPADACASIKSITSSSRARFWSDTMAFYTARPRHGGVTSSENRKPLLRHAEDQPARSRQRIRSEGAASEPAPRISVSSLRAARARDEALEKLRVDVLEGPSQRTGAQGPSNPSTFATRMAPPEIANHCHFKSLVFQTDLRTRKTGRVGKQLVPDAIPLTSRDRRRSEGTAH